LIRGCPNGETPRESYPVISTERPTQGTETSQYLEEEKSNEILLVAASERGRAQTGGGQTLPGLRGPVDGTSKA
jgi:hypothetical protein